MNDMNLTIFGNLSYTARRVSPVGLQGGQLKTIVYWVTKDRERKREVMDKLGIRYTSVNGESEYNGDVEKLREYVEEGLIAIRMKE